MSPNPLIKKHEPQQLATKPKQPTNILKNQPPTTKSHDHYRNKN